MKRFVVEKLETDYNLDSAAVALSEIKTWNLLENLINIQTAVGYFFKF